MKHLTLFVAAALALGLVGCGGNGNDRTDTGGESIGTPRIEAVVRVERTNLINPSEYTDEQLRDPQAVDPADLIEPSVYGVQDTLNFQTGESYYFQLVAYTPSGRRVILPANFTTDDVDFTYGVVGDSGLYLASNVPSTESVFVAAEYRGARYTANYKLNERQARLLGKVVTDSAAGTPLSGVRVDFFDELGRTVATVRSGFDGTFRASVPINAVSFTVNDTELPTSFFRSYVYDGLRFSAGNIDCRSPLALFAPGTFELPVIAVTPRVAGEPTPTPDGCVTP